MRCTGSCSRSACNRVGVGVEFRRQFLEVETHRQLSGIQIHGSSRSDKAARPN